jgi:hypothetical protein
MKYLDEIKEIVFEYSNLEKELNLLEEQAQFLNSRKNEIELKLSDVRAREFSLIDKIKKETGKEPDYYKIMNDLNEL